MNLTDQLSTIVPQISFEDTETAFRNRSDWDLFIANLVLWMVSRPLLVKILSSATKLALAMRLPIKPLIKETIFAMFCGGEDEREYSRRIKSMSNSKIGTILDYAVEGNETEEAFDATQKKLLELADKAGKNPDIPCTCLKMTAIAPFALLEKMTTLQHPLSDEDKTAWRQTEERLNAVCEASCRAGKPIYIDAEESWIQGAIDTLVESSMEKYNREKAVVFTTLQLYRWDRVEYLRGLIEKASKGGYRLGIKIVRGAYMEKERERARAFGYPSPITASKEETDQEYNDVLRIILDNINLIELCAGTHNEESCLLLTRLMAEKRLPNNHPNIYFAQLFGMSDHISYNLARHGYNISKYLPFGPVEATLPYLVRRAEENTSIAGQMTQELEMIITERRRRKLVKSGKHSR